MLNILVNEINTLNKKNKSITFAILSISLIFSIMSGTIFIYNGNKNLELFNTGVESLQISILLFMVGIAIGVLLNLIDKRKNR